MHCLFLFLWQGGILNQEIPWDLGLPINFVWAWKFRRFNQNFLLEIILVKLWDLFWVSTKSICSLLIHVLLEHWFKGVKIQSKEIKFLRIYFVQEFGLSWRKNANWIIWNSRYHFQTILVHDVLKVPFLSLFVSSMGDSFILNLYYLKFKDFMSWVQKFKE